MTDYLGRENAEFEYNKQQADKYFEEARAQRDELHARALEFYAAQRPRPLPDAAEAIDNSRSAADREAAANLLAFASRNQTETADDNARITFLIDALRAQAPNDLPEAQTEIESLRNLQQMIERRIQALTAQTELEATTAQVPEAASSPVFPPSPIPNSASGDRSESPEGVSPVSPRSRASEELLRRAPVSPPQAVSPPEKVSSAQRVSPPPGLPPVGEEKPRPRYYEDVAWMFE